MSMDLQVRYDILKREVQRERADNAQLQAEMHAAFAEMRKLREALGLRHYGTPKPARNVGGGDGR